MTTIDRQWGFALGGSLALHIAGVIIAILLLWLGLMNFARVPAAAEEEDPVAKEREITMLIPEKIIVEEAPKERAFVESDNPDNAEAPDNAAFQSNANMRAASLNDPTEDGDRSKGAQDGRDAANIELRHQDSSPETKKPGEETVTPPDSTPPSEKMIGDNPVEPVTPPKKEEPSEEEHPSEPSDLKVRTKTGGAAEKSGDPASVDAEATPRGRYMSEVKAAIALRYRTLIEKRGSPAPGILKIRMEISPDGSIGDTEFLEDSADALLKDIGFTAIFEAKIPSMPEEVKESLDGGNFIVDYEFVSF